MFLSDIKQRLTSVLSLNTLFWAVFIFSIGIVTIFIVYEERKGADGTLILVCVESVICPYFLKTNGWVNLII